MRHRATPVTESALLGVAKGALETKARQLSGSFAISEWTHRVCVHTRRIRVASSNADTSFSA